MITMNSNFEDIKVQDAVIQSILNRLEVLETKPDLQREMLSDYVRNFDNQTTYLSNLSRELERFSDTHTEYIKQVNDNIANKKIIIDSQVIGEIMAIVQRNTGFNLRDYISKIQQEAIQRETQKATKEIKQQFEKDFEVIKKELSTVSEAYSLQEQSLDRLYTLSKRLFIGFIGLLGIGGFSQIIVFSKFAIKHPILSIFILIICLVAGFLVVNYVQNREED